MFIFEFGPGLILFRLPNIPVQARFLDFNITLSPFDCFLTKLLFR